MSSRRMALIPISFLTIIFLLSFHESRSEDIIIATWNVKDALSVQNVKARKNDFKKFAQEVSPDVLLIQEVTSEEIVIEIRDAMGIKDYYLACSDFVQSDGANRNAFEVAIVSRYPFGQIVEYDPTPDNKESEEDPDEVTLEPLKKLGIKESQTSRGFLWASIPELKLTVVVVHLKSSLGAVGFSDSKNAEKREFVVAGVAASVLEDFELFPDYTCVVGGDFNVGHSDKAKNGKNLKIDCYEDCGNTDLYDDTHALLKEGLVGGVRMRNLVSGITGSTYPSFPGSPIDNIYVAGPAKDKFQPAKVSSKNYGSDHLTVWTVLKLP